MRVEMSREGMMGLGFRCALAPEEELEIRGVRWPSWVVVCGVSHATRTRLGVRRNGRARREHAR